MIRLISCKLQSSLNKNNKYLPLIQENSINEVSSIQDKTINEVDINQDELSSIEIIPIKLSYHEDRLFINNNIIELFKKYKIEKKDIEIIQFIYNSTFSPIYHALLWKLLECVIEKTNVQDNFIFNDSGNILAYYEYNVLQYPFDDDIDIGFITDADYNTYKQFMKDCIINGFDIFIFEKINEDKNYSWVNKKNARGNNIISIDDIDKYNSQNIWFIKVKMSYIKFIELSKKFKLNNFNLNLRWDELSNISVPWIDIFPWVKKLDNFYYINFAEFLNFLPLSVELVDDILIDNILIDNIKIKHPKNLQDIVEKKYNKCQKVNCENNNCIQYKTGCVIYNHTTNIVKTCKFNDNNIINFIEEYIINHNIEIKNIMNKLTDNDIIGTIGKQPHIKKNINKIIYLYKKMKTNIL